MIEEGQPAPDFTLESDTGERVSLSDYRGRPVVLYLHPADDTPGCTAQACGFRDDWEEYQRRGAVVLGVSPDDVDSHVALPAEVRAAVHAPRRSRPPGRRPLRRLGREELYGKTHIGVIRSTFVIDPEGNIATAMPNVRAQGNSEKVLAAL